MIVATNYFLKWIEEKLLTRIIVAFVKSFVWKNIICRFRIPHTILIDYNLQSPKL